MLRTAAARYGVEETRQRILAAARALYACKGSRGTTTREVADQAGVNEATLFRHFGTKRQLLAAMLEHFNAESSLPEVLEGLHRYHTIEEQLAQLGMSAIDSLRRKEDLIKVAMAEGVTDPASQVACWRAPTATKENLSRYFRGKIESGELRGDPDWLAWIFMSMFFSYVMARQLWAALVDAPQNEAIHMMIEVFLNGARA